MERISSDVFTQHIFLQLSEEDRYALLAAFPNLSSKVKWSMLYLQKNTEHDSELLKIYDKHFPEEYSKESRLKFMKKYYNNIRKNCLENKLLLSKRIIQTK